MPEVTELLNLNQNLFWKIKFF